MDVGETKMARWLMFFCLAPLAAAGVAAGGSGHLPKVLHLDGNTTGLQVASCKALELEDAVTLEAWIRPARMGRQGGRIIDKGRVGTNYGYMLDTFPGRSLSGTSPRDMTETGPRGPVCLFFAGLFVACR